jgi:predicted dehydrogenase
VDRTIRVAVVGLGWPGMRHLEAYLKHPSAEVVAVCDANPTLLAAVQRQHQIELGFENLESLLALDGLEAVSICTPNFLHEPMVCAALAAGKHVLCEKPLAATLEQGERIAATARASDRVCMVGFSRRYRDDSRAVKALVESGELGEIYHARTGWLRRRFNPSVRGWFLSKALSGGGPLIDLGVHMLDLALWLMGSPKAVSVSGAVSYRFGERLGRGAPVDVEDLASAYVRLDNGAVIILETSWYSFSGATDHIFCELLGTRGGAKIDLGTTSPTPPVEVYVDRGSVPLVATPVIPAADQTTVSFSNEVAEFIAAIQEERAPASTVEQGLEILRILDAIYRSAEAGAEVRLRD